MGEIERLLKRSYKRKIKRRMRAKYRRKYPEPAAVIPWRVMRTTPDPQRPWLVSDDELYRFLAWHVTRCHPADRDAASLVMSQDWYDMIDKRWGKTAGPQSRPQPRAPLITRDGPPVIPEQPLATIFGVPVVVRDGAGTPHLEIVA